MLKPQGHDKPTKCCELTIHLTTGVRIVGTYHIPTGTSSAIRPSDALRDTKDGFLILTRAIVHQDGTSHDQGAVMIRMDSIAYVDLPAKGWSAREGAPPAVTSPVVAKV